MKRPIVAITITLSILLTMLAGCASEGLSSSEITNSLPPEPQTLTFTASDGMELQGVYYPAATNPAPLVVLMHWMQGDMNDWNEVAVWLQNRGLDNPFTNPGDPAVFRWWDPTWFPEIPADRSYGVFVFSFRTCLPFDQGGCQTTDRPGWLLDAQAAMLKALELEGVDPERIVTIGDSIGADGAVDGCLYLNQQTPGACKGAMSLTPGSYLSVIYQDVAQELGQFDPPVAAWCLADEGDFRPCQNAEESGNSAYQDFMIEHAGHGIEMIKPNLDPLPMQLILDFLDETVP